ncbi:MAG TPA: adenylate/guanylate cyclase domain-containing protein [Crenalkalicoccus sp.]|nr:adenylate/guanylate cyclase domain-containing protein [Crenalkalicoccus sp.]
MHVTGETAALFAVLRESARPDVAAAIEAAVREAPDRALCRVNALAFAEATGCEEEATIAGFLHAARLGICELHWNVLCPGCGGVLEAGSTLKGVKHTEYNCALCAAGYEPTLDEMVEVTFTASPRVRRIAAHDPHALPWADYFAQVFWGSGVALPEGAEFERLLGEIVLELLELQPFQKATLSLQLPEGFVIVFDPVVHMAHFLDVRGAPTKERRNLTFMLDGKHAPTGTTVMQPGPLRIMVENRTATRTLPGVWIAGDALHGLLGRRRPFLTAKRLLSNQTFRDIYRTDTIDVHQRLKITSLTFLFTDLRGSTELYERVGDLAAYDLVQEHFRLIEEIVAAEAGAVVKTIGDAVMATFPTPERAVSAALRIRRAMREHRDSLLLKIGIHAGPCLAVMLNAQQDYFGQTVNIASRVQRLATASEIYATGPVVGHPAAQRLLEGQGLVPAARDLPLRGVSYPVPVFEIP